MNMETTRKNAIVVFGIVTYSFISLLIIFYNHHYYDDEIFNLSKMRWSFSEIFIYINGGDVHPPLSYLINKIIFDIFYSYKAILIFSIILNGLALGYFYNFSEKTINDKYSKILLFIFVFLNGGLLLWTNSVRWYAYWVPLFIILYTYILKHRSLTTKNIIIISLLLSVMTYINYLTFLLLIALFVYWILLRRNDLTIKNIFLFCLVYFSLSIYQIFVFLTVHSQNKESQVSNIFSSALNAIFGVLNGGSVFIADPIFLLFSIATLVIIIMGIQTIFAKEKAVNPLLLHSAIILMTFMTLMIVTGVSGKFRNNIALSIPFYLILIYLFDVIKNTNIKRIYTVIVLMLTAISVFNLVTHTNTSKNSYNMPIHKLDELLKTSKGKIIFTYDPTTFFYFSNKGYKVYYMLENQLEMNMLKGTEVFLIQTYQGILSDIEYKRTMDLFESISDKIGMTKTDKLGIDKYAYIKNMLPGNRAKIDKVQMYIYHGKLQSDLMIPPWSAKDGGIAKPKPPHMGDARATIIKNFLQGFRYRFLVDAKIYEIEKKAKDLNLSIKETLIREYGFAL